MAINRIGNIFSSAEEFLSQLLKLATNLVWKNQKESIKNERHEYSVQAEIFTIAAKEILSFENIYQFSWNSLVMTGIPTQNIRVCMENKNNIPPYLRDIASKNYVKDLLDKDPITGKYINYEEKNDYYRMLNGMPNLEEDPSNFLYQNKYDDIPKDIPIHLLSRVDRIELEYRGYYDELFEKNKDKKYIKYLGKKNIDLIDSRLAERFSILYLPGEYDNLYRDFMEVYNQARQQIMAVYFNNNLNKYHELLEEFLAMCIMLMTIQRMCAKYLTADIDREFYDIESIKCIYEAYGVPFYSKIPLDYHRRIVKHINILLKYKGSTKVFFELFKLFDFSRVDLYYYYLIREHKLDEKNKPIFEYLPDGKIDKKRSYRVKMGKVRLYDNPPNELANPDNHVSREDITREDPYWIEDEELLDKLYEEEYNYLETKYIGIHLVFDMMKIVFECCYLFKMLIDNRTIMEKTMLIYTPIGRRVSLFSLVIYISSLICKKYGYEGMISSKLPFLAKVYGFNFKENIDTIRTHISKNPHLKNDPMLDSLLFDYDFTTIEATEQMYRHIMQIRKYLINKMLSTTSRVEYFAYKDLIDLLLTSTYIEEVFKKSNGEIAESLSDLLSDIEPDLYIRYSDPEISIEISDDGEVIRDSISDEISYTLTLMKALMPSLKYIQWADGIDITKLISELFKLMDFFKSAKAQLINYNIAYTISSRGLNYIKWIVDVDRLYNAVHESEREFILIDLINNIKYLYNIRDKLVLQDRLLSPNTRFIIKDFIKYLQDVIRYLQDVILDKEYTFILQDIIVHEIFSKLIRVEMGLDGKIVSKLEKYFTTDMIQEEINKLIGRVHRIEDIDYEEIILFIDTYIPKLIDSIYMAYKNDPILQIDEIHYEINDFISNDRLNMEQIFIYIKFFNWIWSHLWISDLIIHHTSDWKRSDLEILSDMIMNFNTIIKEKLNLKVGINVKPQQMNIIGIISDWFIQLSGEIDRMEYSSPQYIHEINLVEIKVNKLIEDIYLYLERNKSIVFQSDEIIDAPKQTLVEVNPFKSHLFEMQNIIHPLTIIPWVPTISMIKEEGDIPCLSKSTIFNMVSEPPLEHNKEIINRELKIKDILIEVSRISDETFE